MAIDTTPGEPSEIVPAATVVIFRNDPAGGPPQILMMTRSRNLSFAGGMVVFPGGRIDPEDYQLAEKIAPASDRDWDVDELATRIAGIRETLEEAGLIIGIDGPCSAKDAARARELVVQHGALAPVLDHFGWTIDADALIPFARWLPRFAHSRVFDTMFYLTDLGTGDVTIAVDQTENTHLFWTSARDALKAADAGDIRMIFPTRRNLERLAGFANFDQARVNAQSHEVRVITPWVEEHEGDEYLTIPDDLGYPVTREKMTRAQRA
jgi:8-oxo-dGTP pyrophosphatase MutT (NUDIX family)